MIAVELNQEQELRGARVGFRRRKTAIIHNLTPRHFASVSRWASDTEGALAELAASVATGLPWTGEDWLWAPDDRKSPPDLGEATEVRWVAPGSQLVLRVDGRVDRDPDNVNFVLVTGWAPTFEVIGYMLGAEVRRRGKVEVWPEREAFIMPPSELTPLEPDKSHTLR